jgi:hypothetical protein
VPYPTKTEDGTKCYKSGSISRFFLKMSQRTVRGHDIQSRIDQLKNNIERYMATHNNLYLSLQ